MSPSFPIDPKLPLGTALIATQLTTALPMPAPSAGYVYEYDPNLGTALADRQSYGPIFGQRAETIGRHKFSLSFSSQSFTFDRVDGIDLHNQPAELTVSGVVVSNHFNHDLKISQNAFNAIYGISDRIDVSLGVPISTVDYGLGYSGSFKFPDTNQVLSAVGNGHRSAQGIGDVNVQVKGSLIRQSRFSLAAGAMLRLPTGDEYNLLGAGAVGIRPFIVASLVYKRVTPHINVGYLLNGKSVLASDTILTGDKRRIPSQFQYAAGADAGVTNRLTLAFDILGYEAIHADHLEAAPVVLFPRKSFNATSGSAGFKARVFGNMLFHANLLFRLNDAGLHSKLTPLIGFSYLF